MTYFASIFKSYLALHHSKASSVPFLCSNKEKLCWQIFHLFLNLKLWANFGSRNKTSNTKTCSILYLFYVWKKRPVKALPFPTFLELFLKKNDSNKNIHQNISIAMNKVVSRSKVILFGTFISFKCKFFYKFAENFL